MSGEEITIKSPSSAPSQALSYSVRVTRTPKNPGNYLRSYSVTQAFKITYKPCWCQSYKFSDIKDIVHQFGEQPLEQSLSKPVCASKSSGCLTVSDFTFYAT